MMTRERLERSSFYWSLNYGRVTWVKTRLLTKMSGSRIWLRLKIIPCGRVLLEKLIITQLVKQLPAFCGTRRFIIFFKRSRHWSLYSARCILSTPSHRISLRSILMLSSYLCLVFLLISSLQVFRPKFCICMKRNLCFLMFLGLLNKVVKIKDTQG
jgi:hypothetical protein